MINVYNLLQFYCTILFSIRDQNKLDNNFFVNYNFFDQKFSDQTETQYNTGSISFNTAFVILSENGYQPMRKARRWAQSFFLSFSTDKKTRARRAKTAFHFFDHKLEITRRFPIYYQIKAINKAFSEICHANLNFTPLDSTIHFKKLQPE